MTPLQKRISRISVIVLIGALNLLWQLDAHAQTSQILQPVGELRPGDEDSQFSSVIHKDGFAYVLNRDGALHVYNLKDLNPSAGYYTNDSPEPTLDLTGGDAMERNGDFLYVAGEDFLKTYDISDAGNPVEVDDEQVGLRGFVNLYIYESFLLAMGQDGVSVYSLLDLKNPEFLGEYTTPVKGNIVYAAAVIAPYLYISEASILSDGEGVIPEMVVFDFSTAPEFIQVNRLSVNNLAMHLIPHNGQLLECGVGHVGLLDLQEPLRPLLLDIEDADAEACGMFGDQLVTNSLHLEVVDNQLSIPSKFEPTGQFNLAEPYGSDASESYFFFTYDDHALILGDPDATVGTPEATLSATALDFQQVRVGESGSLTVTLTNSGTADLVVSDVQIEGTNPDLFALDSGAPGTLTPGASLDFTVSFTPAAAEFYEASLTITDNAEGSPRSVALSGQGIEPALVITPATVVFPDAAVGAQSTATVELKNDGTADLSIETIAIQPGGTAQDEVQAAAFSISTGGEPGTLAAGETRVVTLVFSPQMTGLHEAEIVVTSDAPGSPHTALLQATGVEPALTITPTPVVFADAAIGAQSTATVELKNDGTADLSIETMTIQPGGTAQDEAQAAAFSITSGGESGILAAGETRTVTLAFSPQMGGLHEADLAVTSNAPGSPHTALLQATGTAPGILLSATSIDFADTEVGESVEESLTISNTGSATLSIVSIDIEGPVEIENVVGGPESFAIVSGGDGGTLGPGETRDIVVAFAPSGEGEHRAVLKITSNDAMSPHLVDLNGVGIQAALNIDPQALAFDDQRVGVQAQSKSVTLTNSGTAPLSLDGISLADNAAGAFSIISGGDQGSLAPGASRNVTIAFSPQATGQFQANLQIVSSAPGSPFLVELSGVGVAPVLTLSDTGIQFPPTTAGGQQVIPLQIGNTGTASFSIESMGIEPSGEAVFSIATGGDPGTIEPGANRVVEIAFKPLAETAYEAVFSIVSNAPGSPHRVTLAGRGTVPGMMVSPVTIRFADSPVGVAVDANALMQNTGSETVTITSIQITEDTGEAFEIVSGGEIGAFDPEGSREIGLRFTPPQGGEFTAKLVVEANVPQSPFEVNLIGKGTVSGASVAPQSIAFADTPVGDQTTASVTVSNTGNVPITMSTASLSQEIEVFAIVSGGNEGAVQPGMSREIVVSFTPPNTGAFSGQLQVSTSASEAPFNIALSGAGVESFISTEPGSLNFPALTTGQSTDLTLVLSNPGSIDFEIERIELRGLDALSFSLVSGGEAGVISPGGTRNLTVRFEPVRVGENIAQLVVVDASTSSETIVPLKGNGLLAGIDPVIEVPIEGEEVMIEVEKPGNFEVIENVLYYRRGGETVFRQQEMQVAETRIIGIIPDDFITPRGIDYYIFLSDGINVFTFPAENPVDAPAHIQVQVPAFTPAINLEPEQYAMISVPIALDNAAVSAVLEDDFGAYDQQAWRFHRWNASGESYIEYSGEESFDPGKAFWLVTREGEPFDVEGGLSVDGAQPFELTLDPGWNQIGSPFPFTVSWANAIASLDPADADLLEDPVTYAGGVYQYNQPALAPWQGYFVFNRGAQPVTLSIEPVEAFLAQPGKAEPNEKQQLAGDESTGFDLQVSAEISVLGLKDSDNLLGFRSDAMAGVGRLDRREAPGIGDYLRVSIAAGDTLLAYSFKPYSEEGNYWDLEVEASVPSDRFRTRKEVSISLVQLGELPDGFEIYVLDRDLGQAIPVENGLFTLSMSSSASVRNVRVIVGTEAFAEKNSEETPLTPILDTLLQGYPNPFRDRTTIGYQVSQRQHVRIEVYNMLGQRITTLVDAESRAGVYEAAWDGRDASGRPAASGVYIYRMRAGDFESTQKVVLVR